MVVLLLKHLDYSHLDALVFFGWEPFYDEACHRIHTLTFQIYVAILPFSLYSFLKLVCMNALQPLRTWQLQLWCRERHVKPILTRKMAV